MADSHLTELSGRIFSLRSLWPAGLRSAVPARDRAINLIAYLDFSPDIQQFVACPIQMKASQEARFGLERKYEKIANLLLAFVRHV